MRPTGRKRGPRGKDGRLLTVIGAINWDISIFEERFARPGEEMTVQRVEELPGGKGANVAVAAARILGRGRVAMLGGLGTDDIAKRQRKELRQEGVDPSGVVTIAGSRSGRAYVLIDSDGRKTIHTHFGANGRVSPGHLRTRLVQEIISRTSTMIVMDPTTETGLAAAKAAKARGATVVYSPGVRSQEGLRAIEALVRLSDYLVLDRLEVRNLSSAGDEEGALERLRADFPEVTIVATLGARGCIVARDGTVTQVGGVDAGALGKKVVNTTGCGDAFLGVFSSYLMSGHGVLEAANWANLAGAIKATKLETRGSPPRGELAAEMRKLERLRLQRLGLPSSRAA